MKDVLLLSMTILYALFTEISPYLKKGMQRKAFMYIRSQVNIKSSTFKLRFFHHFCIDVYATKICRNAIKHFINDIY